MKLNILMIKTFEIKLLMKNFFLKIKYLIPFQKAKSSGDSAKARRFSRGLTTLNDQRKKVKAGKGVDLDDIPPPIAQPSSTQSAATPPLQPTPAPHATHVPQAPAAPLRVAPPPPVPARSAPPAPVEPPPPVTVTVSAPHGRFLQTYFSFENISILRISILCLSQ
jgi:hypothetical protein